MHTSTILLAVLSGSSLVAADLVAPGQALKNNLMARQTDAGSAECLETLTSIANTVPTPPPELADIQPGPDPCEPPEIPADVAPVYSSYTDEVKSWVAAVSDDVFAALSQCPEFGAIASEYINSFTAGICTSSAPSSESSISSIVSSVSSSASESSVSSVSSSASESSVSSESSASSSASESSVSSSKSSGGGGGGGTPTSSAGGAQSSGPNTALAARETGFIGAAMAAAGFLGVVAVL